MVELVNFLGGRMYSSMGKRVTYQGAIYVVQGCAPAAKVSCGDGFAVRLVIDGVSAWVNSSDVTVSESDVLEETTRQRCARDSHNGDYPSSHFLPHQSW
jgi:hypothetical protein